MNKKLVIGLFMIFMFVGFASAMTTVVQIKTLPSHDVYVTPIRVGSSFEALVQTMHLLSDGYGDVEASFDLDENAFDLAVLIKNGEERVLYEKFTEEYTSGLLINLTVAPEGAELFYRPEVAKQEIVEFVADEVIEPVLASNETLNNDSIEGEKSSFLNGLTIVNFNKPYVKIVGYSLGGIIILVIVFILVRRRRRNHKIRKNLGYKDKKEERENKGKGDDEQDSLDKAERDMKAAQERVNRFKNNDQLLEAKKKLIEAEKELLRLRGVIPETISMKERLQKELEKKE